MPVLETVKQLVEKKQNTFRIDEVNRRKKKFFLEQMEDTITQSVRNYLTNELNEKRIQSGILLVELFPGIATVSVIKPGLKCIVTKLFRVEYYNYVTENLHEDGKQDHFYIKVIDLFFKPKDDGKEIEYADVRVGTILLEECLVNFFEKLECQNSGFCQP
jgi:hypothetical protein